MRSRDTQRGRLYKAERECFGDDWPTMQTVGECQAYADMVTSSQWWKDNAIAGAAWCAVSVKDGRGCRRATAGISVVTLPRWARSQWVILHELAHIGLARVYHSRGWAAHGPEYAAFYVALVQHFLGRDWAWHLKNSFREHGVKRKAYRSTRTKVIA